MLIKLIQVLDVSLAQSLEESAKKETNISIDHRKIQKMTMSH